jgi:uncharacterized protein (TIGR01244 family)
MSLQITRHTADFATAAQIMPDEVKEVAALGFKTLINNRPDGEAPGQPTSAEIEAAAGTCGLHYVFLPVVSSQVASESANFASQLAAAPKPALAFCRSGTRSSMLFAAASSLK